MRYAMWLASWLLAAASHADGLPDPNRTPGALNPAVTQKNIKTTICAKGWVKSVRPPASYTAALKEQQIKAYGYADADPKHYEEDHFIPMELGGDARDPKNLWPQPLTGEWTAKEKNKLEGVLNRQVCARQLTLEAAQNEIRTQWIEAYKKHRL